MKTLMTPLSLSLRAFRLTAALLLPLTWASRTEAAPPADASGQHDCEEMEECFIEGLDLSDDQQRQIRDLMEAARAKQEALRDDTYHRIRDILTPGQGRKLDEHRSDILRLRAQRLRQQAELMDRRARKLREAQ